MASLSNVEPDGYQPELPYYLPARMVNEFVYCPRLFFYEWVEGIFVNSKDTLEGAQQHQRVDREGGGLPPVEELPDDLKTRAITLSSETHRVIAKIDVLEAHGGIVTPVDYKRGRPLESGDSLEMWPSDRVQLVLQALILRENGYRCEEVVAYYSATKQRVRMTINEFISAEAISAVRAAWASALQGVLPPPLEDSPKCPGCSLAGICLPEETNALLRDASGPGAEQIPLFGNRFNPQKNCKVKCQAPSYSSQRTALGLPQHTRSASRQVRHRPTGKREGDTSSGNPHA